MTGGRRAGRPAPGVGPVDAPARTPPDEARLDRVLMLLAVLVFAATRGVGLDQWPVYFFTDEAVQAVRADELLRRGWRDAAGQFLPTYFENGVLRPLSLSVYVQTLPQLLSGGTFHVGLTRGVSALFALSGVVAVALTLKQVFAARFWWVGALLLAMAPAWFLHSRTAFETVLATALYAWFLHAYLRYRCGSTRYLYLALLFGALTFYAYNPARVVVAVTALGLLLSDFRFHLRMARERPALVLGGALLLVALALPYLRHHAAHPAEWLAHLRLRDSHWTNAGLSPAGKLRAFAGEYLGHGLNPWYWYAPDNARDLIRHRMKGYGNLWLPTLPLALLGLALALRRWRSPACRAVIVALLAAPLGAAMAEVHVTRALAFLVPATLLTALGLVAVLDLLARRYRYRRVAIPAFAALAAVNVAMLGDALSNGPLWYRDYGLGGLQYGAEPVFRHVGKVLAAKPESRIHVSPTWANGTDVLKQFFLPDEPRVDTRNIDAFRVRRLPLDRDTLVVATAEEYARTASDRRFADVVVEHVISHPDGSPGFYFLRLAYSRDADAIFAAEDAARRQPVTQILDLDGDEATVVHSRLDVGRLVELFDGDPYTLVRSEVDNPFFVDIRFARPRDVGGLSLTTGTLDFEVTAEVHPAGGGSPIAFTRTFAGLPPDPSVTIDFAPRPPPARRIRIAVRDLNAPGDAKIHVRDIGFRP